MILLAVIAVTLVGCQKEIEKETTCQVKNISGYTLYDVEIWEYDIHSDMIEEVELGTLYDDDISRVKTMADAAVNVIITFRATPTSDRLYTAFKERLTDGQNNIVTLSESTLVTEIPW